MKRIFAAVLLAMMLNLTAVPIFAAEADVIIDSPTAPFPTDTTIEGDLIITGDCPQVVVLINVEIQGILRVEAEHRVTIRLQGTSSCSGAELNTQAELIGGTYGHITVNTKYATLQDGTADSIDLACENSLLSISGTVGTLTYSAQNAFAGGTGRAEKAVINATGCTVNLRCGEIDKNVEEVDPDLVSTSSSVKGTFTINPTVSPTDSVVNATITFINVSEEMAGDYRIYWYIGDTLSYYEWNYTLEEGATAEFSCSVHFDGVMNAVPVWVRLVSNYDDETELRFVTQVQCVDYSTAEYDAIESSGVPYSIHLLRNQGLIIVYGLDDKGEYTKIVNVFPCSVGYYNETAVGDFEIGLQMRWGSLMADLYGQYCSQFNGNQLFHSVPYRTKELNNIEFEEYPKLGEPASSGCVRLCVADAKWIYTHCYPGTPVHVYDSEECPVVKPIPAIIREDSLNRGWDPTDPDPDNPTKASNPPKIQTWVFEKNHPMARLIIN